MTGMLASVGTLEEAEQVLRAGADIIDLKAPAAGALGALATRDVEAIVQRISSQRPVSATIGDLPLIPATVADAVAAMAATGVDFIKIGFSPAATRAVRSPRSKTPSPTAPAWSRSFSPIRTRTWR
ncbi:MAG: (5-formylfuran-3-yl)methyl phosphate synthase [Pseudomonadota bacterium]